MEVATSMHAPRAALCNPLPTAFGDSSCTFANASLGSAPGVEEVLTARASQKRTSIPPPTRSPIRKTNIGGTPRRHLSLGPQSSPQRNRTPEPPSSPQRSVPRLLNFSMNDPVASVERSPVKRVTPKTNGVSNGTRRSVYSLERSPMPARNILEQFQEEETEVADDEPHFMDADALEEEEDALPGIDDDDDGGPMDLDADERLGLEEKMDAASVSEQRRKSGRRSDQSVIDPALISQGEITDPDALGDVDAEGDAPESPPQEMAPPPVVKRKPGRPKKAQTKGKTTALAKKDSNAARKRAPAPKSTSIPRDVRAGSVASLQREREYTPNEDDGANFTRSGRLSYKPLAYWKGEAPKYEADGRHGMQTIHSVVRKEDITPVKRVVSRPNKATKRKYNVYNDDDNGNDEETNEEPWEVEEGIVSGIVDIWDPSTGGPAGQHDLEIAIAGRSIEARDVQGAQFRYAKTLSLGFFGSGIVEMPAHGFKRMKNSRKMAMVFFVHYGKVAVEVAGTRFTISKGGTWQVPRGRQTHSFIGVASAA